MKINQNMHLLTTRQLVKKKKKKTHKKLF